MVPLTLDGVARVLEVILTGAVAIGAKDVLTFFIRRKTDAEPKQVRTTEQGIVERALINVQRSNDELSGDITRTRDYVKALEHGQRQREEWWQDRWDAREERWNRREAELLYEMDSLRTRMAALLDELDELRVRAADGLS